LNNKIIAVLLIISLTMSVASVSLANNSTSSYSLLGTNMALGSPILDPNFTADDWNKWEMLTWGVFLSNFAVPFIDDYNSAFNSNASKGSKGSGYRALVFGSGSDPANADIIKGLLNYAITQQRTGGLKPISVSFNDVTMNKIESKIPSDDSLVRPATLKDLFIAKSQDNGDAWVGLGDTVGWHTTAVSVPIEESLAGEVDTTQLKSADDIYMKIATINSGKLPTFYIKYGSSYEKIFDYTDGWDAQIMTALIGKLLSEEHKSQFSEFIKEAGWESLQKLGLYLDPFGNIVVQYNGERRIIIPAATNQHLTTSPKINLINSLILNGSRSDISGRELNLRGQQSVSGLFDTNFDTKVRYGGLPALGSHIDGIEPGLITIYYDLDTILYQNHFYGGEASNGINPIDKIEGGQTYYTHYGKAVKELFNSDINKSLGNNYMFKIEPANMDKFNLDGIDANLGDAIKTMVTVSGIITNINGKDQGAKILSELKQFDKSISIFGEPVIIPVQMDPGRKDNKINDAGAGRAFIQYLYEAYNGGKTTTGGDISSNDINVILTMTESKTMLGFRDNIVKTKDGYLSKLIPPFIADRTDLFHSNIDLDKLQELRVTDTKNPFKDLQNYKDSSGKPAIEFKFNATDKGLTYFPGRLIKAYPASDVMLAVGNVLGVREGTEFSLYSTYIYMTYLDWYGVTTNRITGDKNSDFNAHIFDGTNEVLNVDINKIINIKNDEDKKREILNYTYMLLNPTEGKEYRREMMNSYISNFMYDTYQKIVYGGATTYYSNINSDLATRNATGFLMLKSYADNFMTGWFIEKYTKIAIFLIALAFLAIIIIGIIKGRKISWYIIALVIVVNTILIVPSVGDLAPLIANNIIQNMFKDKMTYWAISEAVTNAKIENKFLANSVDWNLSGLNQKGRETAVGLIKTLNTVYLDRALMIKSDISKKVTQTSGGNFEEVQKLRSARWMLPMIMRQFTSNNSSMDYVYIPLGDVYDDLSNLYWLYKPDDALLSSTVNGAQLNNTHVEKPINIQNYFPDYKETDISKPYRSASYQRGVPSEELPHTFFYILKADAKPASRADLNADKKSIILADKRQPFYNTSIVLEQEAGSYNRFDRSSVKQSYGYLWATENPYHYFYQVIKDSFDPNISLGKLIGDLQGQYTKVGDTDKEVRKSFMHAEETGYIKDILDIEEMFTNMLPYIYQMQITSDLALEDAKIKDYEIYKGNKKSWLFRSNWATKIMESPVFTKPAIVRDKDGNKIEIKNPTLIDSYPSNRPMVFSEAQMHELGLNEADLNIVELKAIKVNKDVSRRWTLLLNYANVPGMTKEVLYRQMATEAVLLFDSEFSPSGVLNTAYKMYPDGIDLRAISFDSVMKMLMLNVTKDTSYIYGDTMKNIIDNSDIFSAFLLLISAFLGAYIIPLARDIAMGLLFYLGFIAIIYALLSSTRQKINVSVGYILSNFVFLGITIGYYAVYGALMAITSTDAVLNVQSIQVNTGNPVWSFIIIIVISIIYIVAIVKMIDFIFKNYRDMGFAVYMAVAESITQNIMNKAEKFSESVNGSLDQSISSADINISNSVQVNNDNDSSDKQDLEKEYTNKKHKYYEENMYEDIDISSINAEIKKGKEQLKNK